MTFLGDRNIISIGYDSFSSNPNSYNGKVFFTSFDVQNINNYTDDASQPHYRVNFTPKGDNVAKATHTTTVSITPNTHVDIPYPTAYYKWSTTQAEPAFDSATWTSFNSGDELTTPSIVGDWYLHIIFSDNTTKVGYIRSNVFNVEAAPPVNRPSLPEPRHILSSTSSISIPSVSSGELSLDSKFRIELPKNNTQQPWNFSVTSSQNIDLPQQTTLISELYSITPSITTMPTELMTVTLAIDTTKLKANQRVSLFYYDKTTNVWQELQDSQVNGNNISAKVTALTTFALLAVDIPNPILFIDVSNHWSTEAIYRSAQLGFVAGYPDSTFQPNKAVTRSEFLVMLMRAQNLQSYAPSLSFADTDQIGEWAKPSIAQAVEAGYILGYPNAQFHPQGEITRAETALIIFRVLAPKIVSSKALTFEDSFSIPNWVKQEITILHELDIIQERENNIFGPSQSMTRAEAVTLILRMLEEKAK